MLHRPRERNANENRHGCSSSRAAKVKGYDKPKLAGVASLTDGACCYGLHEGLFSMSARTTKVDVCLPEIPRLSFVLQKQPHVCKMVHIQATRLNEEERQETSLSLITGDTASIKGSYSTRGNAAQLSRGIGHSLSRGSNLQCIL